MRLQSAQDAAERAEREALNLKMEVAHLRERLRARVGGDTTAVELEAENATLRAQVADAEQAAAAREAARRALQDAHDKATLNLLKLDRAWKASADELRVVREREEETAECLEREREARAALAGELDALSVELIANRTRADRLEQAVQVLREDLAREKRELENVSDRERELRVKNVALEEKLARMQEGNAALQNESEASRQQAKDTELALEETSRQLAQLQQESARGQMEREALRKHARDAQQALKDESKRLAVLQETADDLRVESAAAKLVVREAETELLKLQEEAGPLPARVAAAEKTAAQHERVAESAKREAARLRKLLQERDDAISLKQIAIHKLERDLEEQARLVRVTAETRSERDAALAKDIVQTKQHEWEKREREWKLQLERVQRAAWQSTQELAKLRTWRASVQQLLEDDTQLDSSDSDDPMVAMVRERLARQRAAEAALADAKLDMANNEDKLTAHTKLLLENEFLRAQVDKTKKVMERVRAMRRASNSPNARAADTSSSSSSSTPVSETKSTASSTSAASTTNRRFSTEGFPIGLGGVRSAERRGVNIGGKENAKLATSTTKTQSTTTTRTAATSSVSSSLSTALAAVPRAKRKLQDMSPSTRPPSWSFSSFLSAATASADIAAAKKPRAPVDSSKRPAKASSASTTPARSASEAAASTVASRSGGSRVDDAGARAKRVFASQYVNVGSRFGR